MKIVHHSNQLGLGGTEKCMQYLLEYLRDAGHDCYCMHNRLRTAAAGPSREALIKDLLGPDRVLGYSDAEEFFAAVSRLSPDVFHVHRSGRGPEFPVVPALKKHAASLVETNVFGGNDPSGLIDLTLYVNDYMLKSSGARPGLSAVLYNPVKRPSHARDMRSALGISPSAFVIGRIGRPDDRIFDPISLRALKLLESSPGGAPIYLVQSPPPAMERLAKELALKSVIFLREALLSDDDVTAFFNTIDVLAHARRDGETFGLNIAEAMVHGRPVVSHESRFANGHRGFVAECGFITGPEDHVAYAAAIDRLRGDAGLRRSLGERGRAFAERNFLLDRIGPRLEEHYRSLAPRRCGGIAPAVRERIEAFYSDSSQYMESLKGNDRSGYTEMLETCAANFPPGGEVLDCGCGLGSFSRLLAARGFVVTGADVSPLFVAEARRRHAGRPGLRFLAENASCLSFPSGRFGGVSSTLFLEHSQDVENTLLEMARVLRPGGALIANFPSFIDPVQHLQRFFNWAPKVVYKPWEARSRAGALWAFIRSLALAAAKWMRVNRRIYYLTPVLSQEHDACGQDYDATWLANPFDVKNLLEDSGMTVTLVFPGLRDEGRVAGLIRALHLPGVLARAYGMLRSSGVIVIAKKPSEGAYEP